MTFPGATTRLCGVVGHPVSHSLSPVIHNAALRHDEIDAVYLAFDVEASSFGVFVEGMAAAGARGLNVTLPHKEAAFDLAHERSPDTEAIGAANVLVFDDDRVVAYNTDVAGMSRALDDLRVPDACRALLLGAGGAARAAVRALAERNAKITISNRTAQRAEEVARVVGAEVVQWHARAEAVLDADLIVNATSLGLDGSSTPLEEALLRAAAAGGSRFLLDLVYGRGETPLVLASRQAGFTAADGVNVLVYQASEAYRLFWGAEAPLPVMRDAASSAARAAG